MKAFLSEAYQRINVEQLIELENHHFPNHSQLMQAQFIKGC